MAPNNGFPSLKNIFNRILPEALTAGEKRIKFKDVVWQNANAINEQLQNLDESAYEILPVDIISECNGEKKFKAADLINNILTYSDGGKIIGYKLTDRNDYTDQFFVDGPNNTSALVLHQQHTGAMKVYYDDGTTIYKEMPNQYCFYKLTNENAQRMLRLLNKEAY